MAHPTKRKTPPPDEKKLIQKLDFLKAEAKRLQAERDRYIRYLYALAEKGVDLSNKKMFPHVGEQKPLHQFILELQAKPGGK